MAKFLWFIGGQHYKSGPGVSSTKPCAESKCLILHIPKASPCCLSCDCLSKWYRLCKRVLKAYNPVVVQNPPWTVVI